MQGFIFLLSPFFRCVFSKQNAVLFCITQAILLNGFQLSSQDISQDSATNAKAQIIRQGSWTKVYAAAQGKWTIRQNKQSKQVQFQLGNDFSTTNGPDLYIIFSPQKASSLNDNNAMRGAIKIGRLKRKALWGKLTGPITLNLPNNLDLAKYKSVAIHCVRYSHLWSVSPL